MKSAIAWSYQTTIVAFRIIYFQIFVWTNYFAYCKESIFACWVLRKKSLCYQKFQRLVWPYNNQDTLSQPTVFYENLSWIEFSKNMVPSSIYWNPSLLIDCCSSLSSLWIRKHSSESRCALATSKRHSKCSCVQSSYTFHNCLEPKNRW